MINVTIFIIYYRHFSNERIPGCILNYANARAKVPRTKSNEFSPTRGWR